MAIYMLHHMFNISEIVIKYKRNQMLAWVQPLAGRKMTAASQVVARYKALSLYMWLEEWFGRGVCWLWDQ